MRGGCWVSKEKGTGWGNNNRKFKKLTLQFYKFMVQVRKTRHLARNYNTVLKTSYSTCVLRTKHAWRGYEIVGYSFMLRSRNQTTNQIPRSYKNDAFDWPFDLVIVT